LSTMRATFAREAHKKNDVKLSKKVHDTLLAAQESHLDEGGHLKSIVYGGLDGIITTFAVVAGASGGGLGTDVILILGFSNIFADALSMGMGDALSTKAENDHILQEREREKWEMENYKEGEVREMVDLYTERGMERRDAELVIKVMAKYEDFFVNIMMTEELGMQVPDEDDNPWKDGFVTFSSFVFFGIFPLLSYAIFNEYNLESQTLFTISICLTCLMLFLLGVTKSRFTGQKWYWSGLEILILGGSTALVSFLIGWFIEAVVLNSTAARGDLH